MGQLSIQRMALLDLPLIQVHPPAIRSLSEAQPYTLGRPLGGLSHYLPLYCLPARPSAQGWSPDGGAGISRPPLFHYVGSLARSRVCGLCFPVY